MKPQHNIRELRQQRDHQEAEEEILAPEWRHVEEQVEGLLTVSKRIVDRVFRFSSAASRPELTVAVAQAMLAKVQLDILHEAARGIIHQLQSELNEEKGQP
jgi:hypothetical protein